MRHRFFKVNLLGGRTAPDFTLDIDDKVLDEVLSKVKKIMHTSSNVLTSLFSFHKRVEESEILPLDSYFITTGLLNQSYLYMVRINKEGKMHLTSSMSDFRIEVPMHGLYNGHGAVSRSIDNTALGRCHFLITKEEHERVVQNLRKTYTAIWDVVGNCLKMKDRDEWLSPCPHFINR